MKRTAALVVGIIVMVFGIVGYASYFKDHPLKFSKISLGGGGSSGGIGGGSTTGNYLKCSALEDEGIETVYVEFVNDKPKEVAIAEFSATIDFDKYTKEEYESEAMEICSSSSDISGALYNCSLKWDGNRLTLIGNINIPDEYKNLSKTEFGLRMTKNSDSAATSCESVTSAPKVTGSVNPVTSVSSKTAKKSKEIEESQKIESSSSKKEICFQLATGNYDDKRNESLNLSFYCDKNVVQKKVIINIVGQSAKDISAGYTLESYKKYLKEKFCDKYNLTNCKYTDVSGTTKEVELLAECNTNYAGLSADTAQELFTRGQSLEEALANVCE